MEGHLCRVPIFTMSINRTWGAKGYILSFLNSPSGIMRTMNIMTRQNQGT